MNKKAKSLLFTSIIFLSVLGIFFLVYSIFVTATPLVIPGIINNEIDDFYSDGQVATFNVTVVWGADTAGNLTVNCSALGDSGIKLALNNTAAGIYMNYTANCTVNYTAIPASLTLGQKFAAILGDKISFTATNASNTKNIPENLTGVVIAYNFTVPSTSAVGVRFGPLMTDLSTITNFAATPYIIDVQLNGTALGLNWVDFQTVALYNFSLLDMSASTIGTQFAALAPPSGINVNISSNSSKISYIFLNSTALSAFNTTTILKLFNLPFKSMPNITTDGAGIASSTNYVYSAGKGNLTFTVNHFSTYNISDAIVPVITVNSPATTSLSQTVAINITFDGTSSSINNDTIIVILRNATRTITYNYSNFTCTIANEAEILRCNNSVVLSDGTYNLTVDVRDMGAGTGNSAVTYFSNLTVDSTIPQIDFQVGSMADWGNSSVGQVWVNVTASDATSNVWQIINMYNSSNYNFGGWQYRNVASPKNIYGLFPYAENLSDGVYTYNVTVTDQDPDAIGNSNQTPTRTFRVDSTAPRVGVVKPTNSFNTSATGMFVLNATINDTGVATIGYAYFNITYANNSQVATYIASLISGIKYSNSSFNITNLADGTYKVKVWANDTVNNINNTELTSLVIDRTAPVLSLGSSATTTSLTLTVSGTDTTGLNGTCNSSRGTVSGFTITESDLTCETSYSYTVSCYDYTAHLGNVTQSFTTSDCESSSGGTGSLGALTVTAPLDGVGTSYTKAIKSGDKVNFVVGTAPHSVSLKSASVDSVTVIVQSTPQEATIKKGEAAKFDLDADGIYDLSVQFDKFINNIYANLIITRINEKAPVVETAPEVKEPTIAETVKETVTTAATSKVGQVIAVIVGIALIIVLVLWILKKRKFSKYN